MHARVIVQRQCCSAVHREDAHTDISVLKTAPKHSHAMSEAGTALGNVRTRVKYPRQVFAHMC
jgi:hypothetical protein